MRFHLHIGPLIVVKQSFSENIVPQVSPLGIIDRCLFVLRNGDIGWSLRSIAGHESVCKPLGKPIICMQFVEILAFQGRAFVEHQQLSAALVEPGQQSSFTIAYETDFGVFLGKVVIVAQLPSFRLGDKEPERS